MDYTAPLAVPGAPKTELDAATLPVPLLASNRFARLRRVARLRRLLSPVLLLVPTALVVGMDLARRSGRLAGLDLWHQGYYFASLSEGLLLWSVLLHAASRRRGAWRWLAALLFVIAFTFAIGGQSYFYSQYNAYLNLDVSLFASNFKDSVVNQLLADYGNYLRAKLPPLGIALVLIWLARRWLRAPRVRVRSTGFLAPALVAASFVIPAQHRHLQAAPPDVLYLNAVGGLLATQLGFSEQANQMRPRARESLPVPALKRAATPKRNVLFVILESVRADATCIGYEPECRRTEATNRLFPERFAFPQMRSMDSTTAVSLAVLWSGLSPVESRENLHTWPLIFDYAHAAGFDTAFWTSQNMLFGNARLWVKNLGVRRFVSATDLDPTSDLDMGAPEGLLADRVIREFDTLHEPFMAVVQLSNVHYPYYLDPSGPQPFQPSTTSKAPEDNPYFKNFYQNAIYQQDQHLAKMLSHVRSTEAGKHTVIIYTSDHAEAFREHNQMGHTFSIFDEEIHVPGWIDAPAGTLTTDEERALRAKQHEYVFHVDLAPTILNLMGVDQDPAIARFQARMPGHSLLRTPLSDQPLLMSNCTGVWSCAFENWGIMQKNLKVESRAWDTGWKCHDVAKDPFEIHNLDLSECGNLVKLADEAYGRLPGQGIPKK
ncbi:MAG TPA: sulfatase-like hydrolase/transferase [Polyangiaceae bacterium]|nr:sulfatase-like hydrolase/transferase [Polyangiaceae bacterium]